MPRIRSIKPQFFKDPDLAELPFAARLFYAGLWGQADREGRLRDEPKLLKVEIAPYDDVDAEELLEQLAATRTTQSGETKAGFIVRYQVQGRKFIWIPTFLKHQKPHHKEPASEIPPAPGDPGESGSTLDRPRADPVVSGFLFLDSGADLGNPPIPPRQEPGGATGTVVPIRKDHPHPVKLKKRNRVTTLAEDEEFRRQELRDRRSRELLAEVRRRKQPQNPLLAEEIESMRRRGIEPPASALPPPLLDTRDAQLAWVQQQFGIGPPEADDVVALMEHAVGQEVRRAPS